MSELDDDKYYFTESVIELLNSLRSAKTGPMMGETVTFDLPEIQGNVER